MLPLERRPALFRGNNTLSRIVAKRHHRFALQHFGTIEDLRKLVKLRRELLLKVLLVSVDRIGEALEFGAVRFPTLALKWMEERITLAGTGRGEGDGYARTRDGLLDAGCQGVCGLARSLVSSVSPEIKGRRLIVVPVIFAETLDYALSMLGQVAPAVARVAVSGRRVGHDVPIFQNGPRVPRVLVGLCVL